ncbi:hypothetical protein NP233_g8274 [Leucocoprinus birnbaumii]|uniref:Uncharacterized protein n=1 Tax=Leucocoprinus birnbaumii TaxID=56174 RepID=A0AAD5YTW4_9AGAR|nr:hypothetical protein NP233_g8274 [Leucocoprinus birnbaumii]
MRFTAIFSSIVTALVLSSSMVMAGQDSVLPRPCRIDSGTPTSCADKRYMCCPTSVNGIVEPRCVPPHFDSVAGKLRPICPLS